MARRLGVSSGPFGVTAVLGCAALLVLGCAGSRPTEATATGRPVPAETGILAPVRSFHPRPRGENVPPIQYPEQPYRVARVQKGIASYYADKFHGRLTANGETFDMNQLTAAHKTLPFGTLVRVTNLENEKKVLLRINDRGPFVKNRIIDVSYAAAKVLDFLHEGVVPVRVEILEAP